MSRKSLLTSVSTSLAMVFSAAALAQGGASAGGEPPAARAPVPVGGGGGHAAKAPAPQRARAVGGGGLGAIAGGGGLFEEGSRGLFAPPPRVHIGLVMDRVHEALAAQLGIDPNEAVLIIDVVEGGPAEQAGMKRFDILTHIDGRTPVTQPIVREVLREKEPGDEVTLRVLRGGESKEIRVTLAEPALLRRWEAQVGGFGGNVYLTPEQMEQMSPDTVYVQPGGARQAWNIQIAPEQWRELRQQIAPEHMRELRQNLRREWREQRPFIEEHLRKLREETDALRHRFGNEWREHWREFKLDEESREKLGAWLESAAEHTASALERLAEALEGVEIEIDVQAPRIEILREGGGVRGMVVHPEPEAQIAREQLARARADRRRAVEQEQQIEREEIRRPAPEVDRRLNRLEERLERMERMIQRLLEREGGE